MISHTGKTQVANNSIGIYGDMNKYTGKKYPLICVYLNMPNSFYIQSRHLLVRLRSSSTKVGKIFGGGSAPPPPVYRTH